MVYRILLILALLFPLKSVCQQTDDEQLRVLLKNLKYSQNKEEKANKLLKAAQHYLNRENASPRDIDSAALLNRQSMQINKALDLKNKVALNMLLEGDIAIKNNDAVKGKELKVKALNYSGKHQLYNEQADIYASLANDIEDNEDPHKAEYFLKASGLYKRTNNPSREAQMYSELSILFNNIDKTSTSIK